MQRTGWLLAWVAVSLATSSPRAASGADAPAAELVPRRLRGLSLTEALQELQSAGLPIVFSSRLVTPGMRVEEEPRAASPRAVLDELLAPHGLRVVPSSGGRLVVVHAPSPQRERPPPERASAEPAADLPPFAEEIVVTPAPAPLDASPAPHALSAADLAARPNLDSDPLRALATLPGVAVAEGSARVHVRGGRDDDVLILLDGLELLAPYHLQEFDSALSIVSPTALERVDLVPSGYPARYGDRMGGVLDLATTTQRPGTGSIGIGLTHLDLDLSRPFAGGRGSWYLGGRGGSYRLAFEIDGRDANPRFWDLFAKGDYRLGAGHSLRLSSLVAADSLSREPTSTRAETYGGNWDNQYLWLVDVWLLGPTLQAETTVSLDAIARDRHASADGPDAGFTVRDRRSLRRASARQVWRWEPSSAWGLESGAELREMGSTVDYRSERRLGGPLAALRTNPAVGTTSFAGRFDYNQTGAFTTARVRWGAVTAEGGVRYDVDTLSDEAHVSPRSSLAWSPASGVVVRGSWGWYHQSQRPNELQVEDGESVLQRAERAEHRNLQLLVAGAAGSTVRVDAFQHLVSRGRSRFVNLFDASSMFPEQEVDRVRIAPDEGTVEGIEVGYQASRSRASWRLAYSYAEAKDRIDGRWVPSATDQRHAVDAGWGYRGARGWSLELAWTYHSGWPTTAVALDGSGAPLLGPLNGERLPAYHRLDARVARSWQLARGTLSAHVDLQNLYDRDNVRGRTDFRLVADGSGGLALDSTATRWNGFFPSFGLRWSF